MKPENNQEVNTSKEVEMVKHYKNLRKLYDNTPEGIEKQKIYDIVDSYGKSMSKYFINKYKGTDRDPVPRWTPPGMWLTMKDREIDLIDNHIWEDESGVKDFYKSYVESPGYKYALENQNKFLKNEYPFQYFLDYVHDITGPDYKYIVDDPIERHPLWQNKQDILKELDKSKTFYTGKNSRESFTDDGVAYVGTNFKDNSAYSPEHEFPVPYVDAHEVAHLAKSINYAHHQDKILELNTRTINFHDSRPEEKHADIWGLKYLLYKEGIHDVRTGHPVTKEHIETLRKKYPKLRPLVQMDDEKVAQMLNLIANNTANPYKEKNKTFA